MLINRKNYEGFFLLYADDELCASERMLVEKFVGENPDLRNELEILQASVLQAQTISFPRKADLFKNEVQSELQAQLLLLIDGEITGDEKQQMASLIETDSAAKNEYDILLQAKLYAEDHVIFSDKHLLYRKGDNNIFIGRFGRWAAAAVLSGIGLFFAISILNKKNNVDIAVNTALPKKIKPENIPDVKHVSPKTVLLFTPGGLSQKRKNAYTRTEPEHGMAAIKLKRLSKEVQVDPENKELVLRVKIDRPVLVKNQHVIAPIREGQIEKPLPVMASLTESEKKPAPGSNEITVPREKAPDYSKSLAGTLKNENKILYMDEDEVKRSRPFAILRKVKRFVERTAQIKPGNTLRIAGFEFKGG